MCLWFITLDNASLTWDTIMFPDFSSDKSGFHPGLEEGGYFTCI